MGTDWEATGMWTLSRARRSAHATLVVATVLVLSAALLGQVYLIQRTLAARAAPAEPVFSVAIAAQDPTWLARKLAFTVRRVDAGGAQAACAAPCAAYPARALLNSTVVAATLEPGSHGTDSAGQPYNDHNLTKLCGPGAAANALFFWGAPVAHSGVGAFTDTANRVTTRWNDDHNRSYLLYLGWYTALPGWPHPGMMDTHDPSAGVTLYAMRDGLNWEASRHDTADWKSYYYTIAWWNHSSAKDLHRAVADDVAVAGVPVVAEVQARLLPNWEPDGRPINHFVTIVGYDDAKGEYYYTDTCGHSTGCGSLADGGVHSVPQQQLWAAISAIPVNTSTADGAGDGGYVW